MTSFIAGIKSFGLRQQQHPIRSTMLYLFMVVSFVGLCVIILQALNITPNSEEKNPTALLHTTFFFGTIIMTVVASTFLWMRWMGYSGLSDIGMGSQVGHFFTGTFLGAGLQSLALLIPVAFGWLRINEIRFDTSAIINTLIITLSALNAGVSEEIVFRGVTYSALRSRWNWWIAAIAPSLVFAAIHFSTNSYEFPIFAAMGLFLYGMLFAWARRVGGSLWLPIGIHFAIDAAYGWFNLGARSTPHLLMTFANAPARLIGEWGAFDWMVMFLLFISLWSFDRLSKVSPRAQGYILETREKL